MSLHANFRISHRNPASIDIIDVGPWDKYFTVTNDAEHVIETLIMTWGLTADQRVFCVDSDNSYGELCHDGKEFTGFKHILRG
jgi:hypothetical protein